MNYVDPNPPGIEPLHVSVKDAAHILGISPHHCNRLLNADPAPIASRYIGNRRLVVLTSLREYAANLPVTRPATPEAS